MKICIPTAPGGHLTEVFAILEAFDGYDIVFIAPDTPRTRDLPYRVRLIPQWGGRFWLLQFAFVALRIAWITFFEKPDIVFSTGGEIAAPAFLAGRLRGARTVFLESVTRVRLPTATGRVVYRLCDLFLVQHPELAALYGRKARYAGSIL